MKDFKEVLLNTHELEFLTGQSMPYSIHIKFMDKKAYNEATTLQLNKRRYSVKDIIKFGGLKLTSSNDPRYDKQEPIMFAVNQLRLHGLSQKLRGEILSDKYCVKKQRLSAEYFILNEVLTEAQLNELYAQLKAKLDYHTTQSPDLMGGFLPDFINFSTKTKL